MKKSIKPKVIEFEFLQKKSTRELLGYLKKLHKCEESFEFSDLMENIDIQDSQTIYFKNTDKWKIAYENVKLILKTREHIKK